MARKRKQRPTAMGERLTVLREQRGDTQAAVAAAVGLERASLSAIELGEVVSRALLRALADYYDTTVDYLERGTPLPRDGGPGHDIKQHHQARLLTGWNMLDEAQRELILGIMAQMLGARVLPDRPHDDSRASPNVNTP